MSDNTDIELLRREVKSLKGKCWEVYRRVFFGNGHKPMAEQLNTCEKRLDSHDKKIEVLESMEKRITPIENWMNTQRNLAEKGWDLGKIVVSNILLMLGNMVFLLLNVFFG